MPNRTARFSSAVFAVVIAGASAVLVSNRPAQAEDGCLAGPKGSAPKGSHWHYRIDRASKHHCWYVRGDAQQQTAEAATPDSSISENANSATPIVSPRKSISDAHAELQPSQSPANAQPGAATDLPTSSVFANATSSENSQAAGTPGANTLRCSPHRRMLPSRRAR